MDNLTLPQVDDLSTYWADNPPVHLLVKAFVGEPQQKAKRTTEATIPDEKELRALAAQFGR